MGIAIKNGGVVVKNGGVAVETGSACTCCGCAATGGPYTGVNMNLAAGPNLITDQGPDANGWTQSQSFAQAAGIYTLNLLANNQSYPGMVIAPFINFNAKTFNGGAATISEGGTNEITLAQHDLLEVLAGWPTVADYVSACEANASNIFIPGVQDLVTNNSVNCPIVTAASLHDYAENCPLSITVTVTYSNSPTVNSSIPLGVLFTEIPEYAEVQGASGPLAYVTVGWLGAPVWILVYTAIDSFQSPQYGLVYATAPYAGSGDTPLNKAWTIIHTTPNAIATSVAVT